MRVQSITVENFRAIKHVKIDIEPVTALIGENNSGKSAILKALDIFFASAPKIKIEDFHAHDVNTPIEITVSFSELNPEERNIFGSKVIGGVMTVTRRLEVGGSKEYLISSLSIQRFAEIRGIPGKADKLNAYREIREEFGLPPLRAADDIEEAFQIWEANNPDRLELTKSSGFFGAENVAVGRLKSKTDFIYVPAIKDVREELDGRSSPVKALLGNIAKQAIENQEDYKAFLKEAEARVANLTSPDQAPQLRTISADLTEIVRRYYAEAELSATWKEVTELPINLPSPDVKVSDGFHVTDVDYVGHGMQRAIILTLLEYMALSQYGHAGEFDEAQSDLILAIEEPELFQHPTKQRLFAAALSEIAADFNAVTGIRVQVIYATHSPLLVSLAEAHRIRRVSKIINEGAAEVSVAGTSLEKCAQIVAELRGVAPNAGKFGLGLHIITSDVAEGFFARKVVLVEGISDVAILTAYFKTQGRDVLSDGIMIKGVDGKRKLDKPILIFKNLGIPTYPIFDNDKRDAKGKKKEKDEIEWNRYLQNLSGVEAEHQEDWPDTACTQFAAWDGNVEKYIRGAAGELYDEVREEMAENYQVDPSDCMKSPTIAASILTKLKAKGLNFEKLEQIMRFIDNLS